MKSKTTAHTQSCMSLDRGGKLEKYLVRSNSDMGRKCKLYAALVSGCYGVIGITLQSVTFALELPLAIGKDVQTNAAPSSDGARQ